MKKCVLLLISTLFLTTSCGEESTSLSSTLDNTSKDEETTSKSENQILLEEIIENYEQEKVLHDMIKFFDEVVGGIC